MIAYEHPGGISAKIGVDILSKPALNRGERKFRCGYRGEMNGLEALSHAIGDEL